MATTIILRNGLLASVPGASTVLGEPLFAKDVPRLYVGVTGGKRLVGVMMNPDATTNPTVNDDSGDGYSVNSLWTNTTTDATYVCKDATVGAAIWQLLSSAALADGDYGDVVVSSSGTVLTIDTAVVTNAKLADMAAATVKGRAFGAGTGVPTDLTVAQLLTVFSSTSGGGTTNFFRADGTWAAPPASGVSQLTGDVTAGPGSGSQAATIPSHTISNAKFRQSAALSVVGNGTNGTADVTDLAAGTDGHVLRRSGTTVGFGLIADAAFGNNTLTIPRTAFSATKRVAGRNTAAAGAGEEVSASQLIDWLGSAAQGDIIYRGASDWTLLPKPVLAGDQFLKGGTTPSWDYVDNSRLYRNYLMNGGFDVTQRGTPFNPLDGAYSADGWILLSEVTSGFGITTGTTNARNAGSYGTLVSSGRYGALQFIEASDSIPLRGKTLRLQVTMKTSNSKNMRIMVGEHTGTADSPTRDIVNNWTSTTYTTGNFFISGSTTIALVSPSIATTTGFVTYSLDNIPISTSCNNIFVFIWAENADTTQNFIITECSLTESPVTYLWRPELFSSIINRCQRYGLRLQGHIVGTAVAAGNTYSRGLVCFPTNMRIAPTLSTISAPAYTVTTGSAGTVQLINSSTTGAGFNNSAVNWTTGANVTVDAFLSAEL